MFEPIKNKKIYQLVIEQIQNMIMDGKLKKGEKLPAERELATRLNVSRTSVREALRSLEILGLIESRQGEGNFISEGTHELLLEPLSVMFKLYGGSFNDILELRYMIEIETARLAAIRINDQEAEELSQLMGYLQQAVDENERIKYDKMIHYKIAEISRNYLVISLLNALSHLLDNFIREARNIIFQWKQDRDVLMNLHLSICRAIINRDPDLATSEMKKHFEYIVESNRILNPVELEH